jgi:hypothetical protein
MTDMGQSRLVGTSGRSRDVRNAPLATVGPKKAACRDGPICGLMHRSKKGSLFDHLIGAAEQRDREGEAECLGGLEVDDQLQSYHSLDR